MNLSISPQTRRVFVLSLPIFAELLLQLLVGNIDQLMISRLGSAAVASVGNGNQVMNVVIIVLETISTALDIALQEEDLVQIKEELTESGYIKRKGGGKKAKITSKPFHYQSSDGYDIFVGKNNYQNDELSFKIATGNDWWFHAKGMPGSHVIVKANNEELPDKVFEEAGRLAGYYSKGRDNEKIEIDYLQKKNLKKPSGAAPGFVVYYTNYSLVIEPDITGIELLNEQNN